MTAVIYAMTPTKSRRRGARLAWSWLTQRTRTTENAKGDTSLPTATQSASADRHAEPIRLTDVHTRARLPDQFADATIAKPDPPVSFGLAADRMRCDLNFRSAWALSGLGEHFSFSWFGLADCRGAQSVVPAFQNSCEDEGECGVHCWGE